MNNLIAFSLESDISTNIEVPFEREILELKNRD